MKRSTPKGPRNHVQDLCPLRVGSLGPCGLAPGAGVGRVHAPTGPAVVGASVVGPAAAGAVVAPAAARGAAVVGAAVVGAVVVGPTVVAATVVGPTVVAPAAAVVAPAAAVVAPAAAVVAPAAAVVALAATVVAYIADKRRARKAAMLDATRDKQPTERRQRNVGALRNPERGHAGWVEQIPCGRPGKPPKRPGSGLRDPAAPWATWQRAGTDDPRASPQRKGRNKNVTVSYG